MRKKPSYYHLLENKQWMEMMYEERRLSRDEIAKAAGCSPSVVVKTMKRLGIKARPRGNYNLHYRCGG